MMATASLPILTAFTAALMALMSIKLTLDIVKLRRAERVVIGDGGSDRLAQAVRLHGNFIEHAPITLIVVGFAELLGAWWPSVLLACGFLVAGRVLHARTFKGGEHNLNVRSLGMRLNLLALLLGIALSAGYAIWHLIEHIL